ncbi:MAG: methionyl-tRNA formyltransferase [Anaerolineaceae bacterium]|nr:MAG: methionyl-tRNA formyltransferase [Anaerolineaceae bacterium]
MAKVLFMGTPDFAVPALQALIEAHEVVAVVTQPDRPAGRGRRLRVSPVKHVAIAHDIPVFQPERLRRPDALETLAGWPADVFVVAAFGQILPQAALDMPAHGSINVHASILPRWRGAAPIHAAIRAGDAETGVTIMQMDAGLDTGPMLSVRRTPITPDDTAQNLHDRLAELGAALLAETLPPYLAGEIVPQPQPEAGVTYAPQITKAEGRIDWAQPADAITRQVRAFTPWPGTFTDWDGRLLKVHRGTASAGSAPAGQVVMVDGRLAIGTGDGLFFPEAVQLEGKQAVSIDDFVRGYPHVVGVTLG